MEAKLKPGLTFEFKYDVPPDKTVPNLYPEAAEFHDMPEVFATGYLVGLIEWACIDALKPHLDWPHEQSVGIDINVNHSAATPPGFRVVVKGKLTKVEGRKLTFEIEAHDGVDTISTGTHQRFIIDASRFNASVDKKSDKQR
jgi:fluoroacetyl-CoA thioesterase